MREREFALVRAGQVQQVEPKAFRLLLMLLRNPNKLIAKEELLSGVWGDTAVTENSLARNVALLRRMLGDDPREPRFIETVSGIGYRFLCPVQFSEEPPGDFDITRSEDLRPPTPVQAAFPRSPTRIGIIAALATVSLLAAIGMTVGWLRQPKKPTLQEPRLITSSGWGPALSRDGKLLAYASGSGNLAHIMVQQTAGGEAIAVTTDAYEGRPDFSPDGTRIAFYSAKNGGGIYITPTLPGEPRLLVATPAWEDSPQFSPSGDSILYRREQKAFTVSVDGGQPVDVSRDFRVDTSPVWGPDGKEILFGVHSRGQNKADDWWIVPLGQGQPRQAHFPGVEQNDLPQYGVRAWVRSGDDREWIIYATGNLESWKLWRISPQRAMDEKPELLLSGNGELGSRLSASEDGKLAYSVWNSVLSIYQISTGDRGEKLGATVQLPLPDGGSYNSPSVSRDGRWMAYNTYQPGKPSAILLRNLSTGTDHLLDEKGRQPGERAETSISPDGSKVIFERDCTKESMYPGTPIRLSHCSFMVAAAGGEPEQICERCTPRGFSSDGSVVLLQRYDPTDSNKDRIVALDLRTKKERDFLSLPDRPVYHPYFSWDDRWVVFKEMPPRDLSEATAQIMIAPVRNGVAAGEAEWLAVTDAQHENDKPQFSPDGNTVYFTSTRDGYLCIWAQRLDPLTKHPVGPPLAYEHFHNSAGRSSANRFYITGSDLSVARDKIMISLREEHSGVWMAQMR